MTLNPIVLNPIEKQEYERFVFSRISSLKKGRIYYFRHFFHPLGRSTPPRLARKFYEDIINGRYRKYNLNLVSKYLRDGFYLKKG